MKKILTLLLVFIATLTLVSCDYPEKSFNALDQDSFPSEVTKDFELPIGIYGKFIYTSSNEDVIKIENEHFAKVTQTNEDVLVTIEARINKKFVNYEIKVLKIGSMKTPIEQKDVAYKKLDLPTQINEPFELVKQVDNIMFEYKVLNGNYITRFNKKDGSNWVVPYLINFHQEQEIEVKSYILNENESKVLLSIDHHIFTIIPANPNNIYYKISQSFEGPLSPNRFGSYIEGYIDLPIETDLAENIELHWYSLDTAKIRIDNTVNRAYVVKGKQEEKAILYLTIIDYKTGFNYPFEYTFFISAK